MVLSDGPVHNACEVEARDAFQYFYEVSAPSLVNYGSQYFWNKLVLQACHQDESIKDLVVAAAALDRVKRHHHEDRKNQYLTTVHSHYYGKALRDLSSVKNPAPKCMLMACLLLILVEELQQNRFGALQHIIAGRKLLTSYISQPIHPANELVDELTHIFSTLVTHTGELEIETLPRHIRWAYNGPTSPILPQHTAPAPLPTPIIPTYLPNHTSVYHAAQHLQSLVPLCLHPSSNPPPLTRFHTTPTTPHLNHWLALFNSYTYSLPIPSLTHPGTLYTIHLLRTHHMCLHILSRCHPFNSEITYDLYTGEFEHVCIKLSHLIGIDNERDKEKLLCPIWFVSTKYRERGFRRMAMGFLARCGWEGRRLGRVVEEVVRLEEGAEEEGEVREARRVRVLGVGFQDGGRGRGQEVRCVLRYQLARDAVGSEGRQHGFSWRDVGDRAVQEGITRLVARMLRYEFQCGL